MRTAIALCLFIPIVLSADEGGGKKNFEASLLQIADLNVPTGGSGLGPAGLRVKVKARQLSDGRLWAREVEAEGGPSRGRSRRR